MSLRTVLPGVALLGAFLAGGPASAASAAAVGTAPQDAMAALPDWLLLDKPRPASDLAAAWKAGSHAE